MKQALMLLIGHTFYTIGQCLRDHLSFFFFFFSFFRFCSFFPCSSTFKAYAKSSTSCAANV